jgi:hypothetical protein
MPEDFDIECTASRFSNDPPQTSGCSTETAPSDSER